MKLGLGDEIIGVLHQHLIKPIHSYQKAQASEECSGKILA